MRYLDAYRMYQSGKSVSEIAEEMGISEKTVRKYIARAKKELGEQPHPRQAQREILDALQRELAQVLQLVQELRREVQELKALKSKIRELERKWEEVSKPIKMEPVSLQIEKVAMDYSSLMEAAKLYHRICELLGKTYEEKLGERAYGPKFLKAITATFGVAYGIAHVVGVERYFHKDKINEWYFYVTSSKRVLTEQEVAQRLPTLKKQFIEAIKRLKREIERGMPVDKDRAKEIVSLYNKIVQQIVQLVGGKR